MSLVGKEQQFKRKPCFDDVIQYTRKNGKEVVSFVNDRVQNMEWLNQGIKAVNGGSYVKVLHPGILDGVVKVYKGDVVVFDGMEFQVYNVDNFKKLYTVSKTNELM